MLTHPTVDKLHPLRCTGMAKALVEPLGSCDEPPRVSRRLHSLSLWEERADEITDKILPRKSGNGRCALVLEHQGEHDSQWSAIPSVSSKLGCTAETLRKWVRQAERDRGVRAGFTSEERRRLKELEHERRARG